MNAWNSISAAALGIGLFASAAAAQDGREAQALVMTASNLSAGDARHREHVARGGAADAVFPGDTLVYGLVFTNVTDVPVRRIQFEDPLPNGLQYVAGSARADRGDVVIEYSIDGGATYSIQPTVEVEENGAQVVKPAPPETYTHVRWRVDSWVQPGAQVAAEFRAWMPATEEASP